MIKNQKEILSSYITKIYSTYKKNNLPLPYLFIFLFFIYTYYLFLFNQTLGKQKITHKKILTTIKIEKIKTQRLNNEIINSENKLHRFKTEENTSFQKSNPTDNQDMLYEINTLIKKRNHLALQGYLPSPPYYKLTLSGDYFELLYLIQSITKNQNIIINDLNITIPDTGEKFILTISLHSFYENKTKEITPPIQPSMNKLTNQLKMLGYLEYENHRWCLLETQPHTTQLFKEGDAINNGFIKTISSDHTLVIINNENYLLPLFSNDTVNTKK